LQYRAQSLRASNVLNFVLVKWMFGQTVADILKTDFVSWFHLRPIGPAVIDQNLKTWSLRPEASQFQDVLFEVRTASEQIAELRLLVGRGLINDPDTALAIRDIIQSFIALAFNNALNVRTLREEIQFREIPRTVLARSLPALPPVPSSVFLAIVGKLSNARFAEADAVVTVYNDTSPWPDKVVLVASRR
jgi:hypothetical protein